MPQPSELKLDLLHISPRPGNGPTQQRVSSPIELHGVDLSSLDARDTQVSTLASLTPLPASPDEREREQANSFFGKHGASPSAGRTAETLPTLTYRMDGPEERRSHSLSTWVYSNKTSNASSPSLSLRVRDGERGEGSAADDVIPSLTIDDRVATSPNLDGRPDFGNNATDSTEVAPPTSAPLTTVPSAPTAQPDGRLAPTEGKSKSNKKRFGPVLNRSKSLHSDEQMFRFGKKASSTPKRGNGPANEDGPVPDGASLKPPRRDRERSGDRAADQAEEKRERAKARKAQKGAREKQTREIKQQKELSKNGQALTPTRDGNANKSTFFNDFRNTSSNAVGGIGKAGKGILNKLTRSGSSHEKQVPEEDHQPVILTLPLIKQTRITRIAKSYDQCKDKTEFWMPALPWRCIDFLNGRCEDEGLYRISGGLKQIKEWRKRFDTELDVNLLDEEELYDANVIASLFKEWIRELPEEIFPKDRQNRVIEKLPPQLPELGYVPEHLRQELQQLPPFNYYLLFAITCHLSLLLSYEEKNKMTLDNLYRCFNQSLKLDGRIFYTLVGDWRRCWAGCLTENDYLREEYDFLQHPYPQYITDHINEQERLAQEQAEAEAATAALAASAANERAISSSDSSAPPTGGIFTPDMQRPATSHTQASQSADEGGEKWISPGVKKSHRSSSDVTGASPMRHKH